MIELVTESGKKVGVLSDSCDQEDVLIIDGKKEKLSDVYDSEDKKQAFNKQLKDVVDDSTKDNDSRGAGE